MERPSVSLAQRFKLICQRNMFHASFSLNRNAPILFLNTISLQTEVDYQRESCTEPFFVHLAATLQREDVLTKLADKYEEISNMGINYGNEDWSFLLQYFMMKSQGRFLLLLKTGSRFFTPQEFTILRFYYITNVKDHLGTKNSLFYLNPANEMEKNVNKVTLDIIRFFVDFFVEEHEEDLMITYVRLFKHITKVGVTYQTDLPEILAIFTLETLKQAKKSSSRKDFSYILNKYMSELFPTEISNINVTPSHREVLKYAIVEGLDFKKFDIYCLAEKNQFDIVYSFFNEGYRISDFLAPSEEGFFIKKLKSLNKKLKMNFYSRFNNRNMLSLFLTCKIKLRKINYVFTESDNPRDKMINELGKFRFHELPV